MKSVWCFFVSLMFLFALAGCDSLFADVTDADTVSEAANATNPADGAVAVSNPAGEELAYLTLSVCDENGNPLAAANTASARTALPQLGASEFSSFILDGSTDGGFAWVRLWASSDTANAYAELTSANIAVAERHWQFRLTAQKGGVRYIGYHARTEIVAGQANTLSFTLSLSSLGADSANSTGSVRVSVNYPASGVSYPASGVSKVTAELRTLLGAVVDGFSEEELSPIESGETKTATYEKSDIPAGTYAVVFRFYAMDAATDENTGKDILLGSWTEYAGIASGVTSISADMEKNTIASLDALYSITYEWNGGSLVSGVAAASFSRFSNAVALPSPAQMERDAYIFDGWYTTADFSDAGGAVTELPAASTGNRTFYARWIATCLYVAQAGSDAAGTGEKESPYATVQKAVTRLNEIAAHYDKPALDWRIYVTGTVAGTATISTLSASSLAIEKEADATTAVLDGNAAGRVLTLTNTIPVTIKGVTITNGIGISGGLLKQGEGALTLDGCTISENNVSQNGVLGISAGTVELVNITVSGNKSSSYTNGGVFISGGTVTMKSGTITGNESPSSAGGVYLGAATFIMEGGTITGNTGKGTSGIGGGVYVANGGTFTMTGGEISGNTAGANGGGVYVNTGGSFTMTGTAVITGNTASTSGGGVYNNGGTATITAGKITDNTATASGGGVYNTGTLTMSGGEISTNTASDGYAGGGVYTSGTFTMTGSALIKGNLTSGASTCGGGILIGGGTAKLGGGTLSGNTAVGSGGAICVKSGALYVYGNTVIGDTTKTTAATESSYSNKSGASGGAIWAAEGTAVYFGYSDASTKSAWTGGIAYNYAATTTANLGGGGISVGGSLSMASGTIAYNGAKTNGGGVLINGTKFTLSGGIITGNTATNGAGVSVYQGTLAMEDGTGITGNTASAGGGGMYSTGVVTMDGGEISANTAADAGGVYLVGSTALFTMNGGKITGNKNTSTGSAGGIGLSGATFTMNDGEISGNESIAYGGAFFDWAGTINIKGGTIKNNTAVTGGAMYINGAGAINLSGGTITGNTATGNGGAIYVNGFNAPTLTMSGSACVAHDNDIYLGDGRTITISGALSGATPVATITPSSYTDGKQVLTGDIQVGSNSMGWANRKIAVKPNAASPSDDWWINEYGNLKPMDNSWVASVNGMYCWSVSSVKDLILHMEGSENVVKIGPGATNSDFEGRWTGVAAITTDLNQALVGTSAMGMKLDMTKATGMTSLPYFALLNCSKITSLELSPTMTFIDRQAMQSCSGLRTLVIPDSVKILEWASLFDCSNLTTLVIGSGVETISSWLTNSASLSSVTFKNTSGWVTQTSGTACDVSNPATNAANLKNASHAWYTEGMKR